MKFNAVHGWRRLFLIPGVSQSPGAGNSEQGAGREDARTVVLAPVLRPEWPRSDGSVDGSGRHGRCPKLAFVFAAILASTSLQPRAETAARPLPAKGSGSRTLIVHTAARSPYALGHELELLKLQLRRVATELETVPAAEATSNKIASADYLVLFYPKPDVLLPSGLLELLIDTNKPLLWVGFGSEQLAEHPLFAGQFATAPTAEPTVKRVAYRGREWDAGGASWHPLRLLPNSTAAPIISVAGETEASRLAICWQHGRVTVFSAVPGANPLLPLFADVLLDCFGAKDVPESRLLLRIDDYQAASNHRSFKRMADFLFSRGHAFVLPVTPAWRKAESQAVEDLDSAPDFVAGLRYAQQRGGRIVLRGCVREKGDEGEFWDTGLDRPPPGEPPGAVREKLAKATALLLKHGLLPVAWQTPQDSASRAAYTEIAGCFSSAIERAQLSDLTRLEQGSASAITLDQYGRLLFPENVGYLAGDSAEALADLKRRAEVLTQLRGAVAGCRFHAYLPFEALTGLVTALEELRTPFLDLANFDHRVRVPGYLLLSGRAQWTVTVSNAPFVRKLYDRNGRLLSTLNGKVALGENTFQRDGGGDYELFEFTETKP